MKLFNKLILYVLIIGVLIAVGYLFCKLIFPYLVVRQAESRIEGYSDIVGKYAKEYHVLPELVQAVIEVESKGVPDVVSRKGAVGLMQVMPSTMKDVAARLGIPEGDLADPDYNIRIGTAYLRILLDRFEGKIWFALAGYHAGPSRVRKWKNKMPGKSSREIIEKCAYRGTSRYVRMVLKRQAKYRKGL